MKTKRMTVDMSFLIGKKNSNLNAQDIDWALLNDDDGVVKNYKDVYGDQISKSIYSTCYITLGGNTKIFNE